MSNYPYEKKPAFFRTMAPEIFFEAEAADEESLVSDLNLNVELESELDAILVSSDAR